VETNTPFWNRLSKGWARGKVDRNLGLVLAIMAERTRLNEKIEKITAPIKSFQEDVTAFYEKLHNGHITSDNFKDESRSLQRGLKETLNTITGKDLRTLLKMRERLIKQQLTAADSISKLSDESKNNLMALIRGESLPGVSSNTPGAQPGSNNNAPPLNDVKMPFDKEYVPPSLRSWLKKLNIAQLPINAHAKTGLGRHQFSTFMSAYGRHPKAVTDYFNNNGSAQAAGFDSFGEYFGEMLRRARQIQIADDEASVGLRDSKQPQGEENTPKPSTNTLQPPQEKPLDLANTDPMIVPPTKAEESKKQDSVVDPEAEKKFEMARRKQEELKQNKALIQSIGDRFDNSDVKSPLARSTAERTAREITRFGRIRALGKIAND
jgi:hypothetical protein